MLKKVIKFTDYDGMERETEAYFNLTKLECMDLDLEYEDEGGLLEHLKRIFANRTADEISRKEAVDFIKLLVERSYGVRPKEDRTLFLKEDDDGRPLIRKFRQTPAYEAFIYALLTGDESLDEFASQVLPKVAGADIESAKKRLEEEGFGKLMEPEVTQFPTAN